MRSWYAALLLALSVATAWMFLSSGGMAASKNIVSRCTNTNFEADRAKLQTIDLKQDGVLRRYYIFQGDNLVAANDLLPLWQRSCERKKTLAPQKRGPVVELNISLDDQNRRVIWPRGQRALAYSIERGSFPSINSYQAAVAAMRKATGDWIAVCRQCGITFDYRAKLDDGTARIASGVPGPGEVTFIVTYLPSEDRFIAASFFPNDLAYKHRLYVTPSFYTSEFDQAGVLRHELGHILGYRHEHLGIAGCPTETGKWQSISGYTFDSVMHYLCGGGGTKALLIVPKDEQAHRIVYMAA